MSVSRFVLADGVTLHVVVDEAGDRSATPIVVLHGFTGSARSMAGVADAIGRDRTVVRVDLLGHGESDAPDRTPPYAMERCTAQLVALLEALRLGAPHWLGYSMGGRVALSLAARHPECVASLTLVGASPGLGSRPARLERVAADEALADDILRDGLPAFVERWMAIPLFESQRRLGDAALAAARRQRLDNRPHGLARSLRGIGTGAMPPLHTALADITRPVHLVVGDEDEKFRRIAAEMAAVLPDARVSEIPDAGHAAHLENPGAFAAAVGAWLAAVDRDRAAAPSVGDTPLASLR